MQLVLGLFIVTVVSLANDLYCILFHTGRLRAVDAGQGPISAAYNFSAAGASGEYRSARESVLSTMLCRLRLHARQTTLRLHSCRSD